MTDDQAISEFSKILGGKYSRFVTKSLTMKYSSKKLQMAVEKFVRHTSGKKRRHIEPAKVAAL